MIATILRRILPCALLLALGLTAHATHNRAGEIIVEQVGDCTNSLRVKATIITYTKTPSDADRDTLTLCWGDGTCERVARSNGTGSPRKGEVIENDIKYSEYEAFHTYTSYGQYRIGFTDPNRVAGILNVNYPNSVNVRFYVETIYSLVNSANQGCNNSPQLSVPPIDFACVGHPFTHNPGASDPDVGDSLSYQLTVPRQDQGLPVPNYSFPDQISPGPNNRLTIDPVSGNMRWDSPVQPGEYNVAIMIISYRRGVAFDTLIRDMQIFVEDCDNEPPVIDLEQDEYCIIAGDTLSFPVTATAPITDTDQMVRLAGYGAPFTSAFSPAVFLPENTSFMDDPLTRTFQWATACEHISDQPYNVVFRAKDNFLGDTSGLATLRTVRIKVVGPPPEDVQARAGRGEVEVTWQLPYACEDAANEFFRGFTVWRRLNSNQFEPDTCKPGLAGQGYEQLTEAPIRDMQDGRYYFLDSDVERGRTYCYRVLAVFGRKTAGGQYYYLNIESLPSREVCVQLSRDLPIITNVDVETTDAANGRISVCWSKPVAGDLDTTLNIGPYRYEVLRATGQTTDPADFQTIGINFTSETFAGANDTCFVDAGLNTANSSYSYLVNFYVAGESEPLGATNPASSLFLRITPTDNTNIVGWDETVPWDNYRYTIFRQNASGQYDSLATVVDQPYRDTGLVNGQSYCYYVRSTGTYGVQGIIDPLLNRSQRACGTPMDDVPPCPPTLTVESVCDKGIDCRNADLLFNTLRWTVCADAGDVSSYQVYYAPFAESEFILVARIDDARTLFFDHQPEQGIAGCYAVTAIDSTGNESSFSNIICVDNCPFYELPNTFTPNGDNQNDLFTPFDYCFIESVNFQVYNRWGQLVFETTNPDLNWDGTNLNGEALAEGTYFYRCRVFERRVSGIEPQAELLSGYIELIRGGK